MSREGRQFEKIERGREFGVEVRKKMGNNSSTIQPKKKEVSPLKAKSNKSLVNPKEEAVIDKQKPLFFLDKKQTARLKT